MPNGCRSFVGGTAARLTCRFARIAAATFSASAPRRPCNLSSNPTYVMVDAEVGGLTEAAWLGRAGYASSGWKMVRAGGSNSGSTPKGLILTFNLDLFSGAMS